MSKAGKLAVGFNALWAAFNAGLALGSSNVGYLIVTVFSLVVGYGIYRSESRAA